MVKWQILYCNKSFFGQISVFNNTINNFSNYIPSKFVTIHDKDPPWMTKKINKIIQRNSVFKSYISSGKSAIDYQKFHNAGNEVSQIITNRKKEYYDHLSKRLNE